MGETRSAFWNDSGLALNLDGTKIYQDEFQVLPLPEWERNTWRPWWDIFFRKMPREMKLKYDPFLDGYEDHGFHDGKNHDGTERTTSFETRNLVGGGSGLTQTWTEDTSWNEVQA